VSVATTALAWRTQFHHLRLSEHVSRFDVGPGSFAGVGIAAAQSQVQTQAQALSYFDVFWLFGIAALVVAPVALLLKKPPPGAAGAH
jgi:DHA2 family multidrug resistance protein